MEREIEASTAVRSPLGWAQGVLLDDPGSVLCDECSSADRAARRFRTVLSLDTTGAGASVRQDVIIEVGAAPPVEPDSPSPDGDAAVVSLPISWRAAGFERLFPTFEGTLELAGPAAAPTLAVRGRYVVPLGPMGRFGDGLVGRRIARRSLAAFLESVAQRLDAEVDRAMSAPPCDVPYPIAFREH